MQHLSGDSTGYAGLVSRVSHSLQLSLRVIWIVSCFLGTCLGWRGLQGVPPQAYLVPTDCASLQSSQQDFDASLAAVSTHGRAFCQSENAMLSLAGLSSPYHSCGWRPGTAVMVLAPAHEVQRSMTFNSINIQQLYRSVSTDFQPQVAGAQSGLLGASSDAICQHMHIHLDP